MKKQILIHCIGWIIFILFHELDGWMKEGDDFQGYAITASGYILRIGLFYFFYSFLGPRYLKKGKWLNLIWCILVLIGLFIGFRFFVEEIIYQVFFGFGNYYDPEFFTYIADNWWRPLPVIMASIIAYFLKQSDADKRNQLLLEQEKTAAELSFLRGQVNPHFLFNTLHFLHTEAFRKDPELADTILQVSDILRYSIESVKDSKRKISQEIKLINNYIDIFKKRYAGQCYVEFSVSGDGLEQLVEPLLLIPFVENAFKHGKFSDEANPILFTLDVQNGKMKFDLKNKVKQQIKDKSSGIGVENVQRRLNLLYPNRHELSVNTSKEDYQLHLTLQL